MNLNLGAWAPYCDTPNCDKPYEKLRNDLESASNISIDPLPSHTYGSMLGRIIEDHHEYDARFQNPYHNLRHNVDVYERIKQILSIMSRSETLPYFVWQLCCAAALAHDLGHPGKTLRRDAFPNVVFKEFGKGISNEVTSAILLDDIAITHGVSPFGRLFMWGMVIATTYGNPEIKAHSKFEKAIAIADVAPDKSPIMSIFAEDINVMKETPVDKRPRSFDEWITQRLGFCEFVGGRMTPEAAELWGDSLKVRVNHLKGLTQDNNPADRAMLNRALARYLATN